ncbi:MAG: ATP-binding domain-containing protein [Planctomycetes bacterium]|nr:ATP-binding domain-containing protein [Planctomycetota bacterium]
MPLQLVRGPTKHTTVLNDLIAALQPLNLDGSLYLHYLIPSSGEQPLAADALLVTPQHGLVPLLVGSAAPADPNDEAWTHLINQQDRLAAAFESHLGRYEGLRDRRRLAIAIQAVTLLPSPATPPSDYADAHFCSIPQFVSTLQTFPALSAERFRALEAALQNVTTIKPAKRRSVSLANSRGSIIKRIEQEISNLDQWQKQAAIESPDGPQRIRGLAGSGKTIVLALKASFLHMEHPDWNIAVTFHSRALYQQFQDLIRRFCFDKMYNEPDWTKLRLLHAWGSADRTGVYTECARAVAHPVRNFAHAKNAYGRDNALAGICSELLGATASVAIPHLFDAVLIDEAQDLPPSFFQLVHRFTRAPKRIVWAYDELQRLSEAAMPTTAELFGTDPSGRPVVQIENVDGQPRADIALPVCYRNPPWVLAVAHAVGLGVYRAAPQQEIRLVQHFDDPTLWADVGYRVVEGELADGANVTLERDPTNTPKYFRDLLDADDSISASTFSTAEEQAHWIAHQIKTNVTTDELEEDDILIVLPSARYAHSDAAPIIAALRALGIRSHLVGTSTSRDQIFERGSVALAHIYRAKGNEAPMVYVTNVQDIAFGTDLISKRNTLFTAITRSRAWVRLCGYDEHARSLAHEVSAVRQNGYRLTFRIPTARERLQLRQLHRDRSATEIAKANSAFKGLKDFLAALNAGTVSLEHLPPDLRTQLANLSRTTRSAHDSNEDDVSLDQFDSESVDDAGN